jgi:hypothetical protein
MLFNGPHCCPLHPLLPAQLFPANLRKRCNVFAKGSPDQLCVDTSIIMRNHVSHCNHRRPVDMLVSLADFDSQLTAIFSDDRQTVSRQIDFISILKKLGTRHIGNTSLNMIDQFKDQNKAILIAVTHNMRTISASTRARILGRIPARETKST